MGIAYEQAGGILGDGNVLELKHGDACTIW